MPLTLRIESELDERSATAAASRAERIYSESARNMSREMSEGLSRGAREGGRAIEKMADDARGAYKRVGDATDELREQEAQLRKMREDGARGVEVQAERVRLARKREKEAIREAAAAYDEYERAARGAAQAGEQAGNSIMSGLRSAAGGAASAGQDAASEFMSGFSGSSALMALGARTGPIGIALTTVAGLGLMTGKVLADNIAAGLQSMATRDLFQARLGIDDASMGRLGQAAGAAYADMWGASVEDNLRAIQFAVQGGVITPGASDAEIQSTIANMQALATVMQVDVQEAARATGQLIRGGFAADGTEAADIIASGFQNGLDIAGDWLDTVTEYTTQFRKLGLDGADALGLIQQGLQGAARDSDVVADSLKEFSIRAVDGSSLTRDGFAALGLDADDMSRRFLAGGESARQAFGVTLQAIRNLDDPIQQALTWQALFGTQWEDMGDAINKMDLSTARSEFGSTEGAISSMTDKLSEHTDQWDVLGRNIDQTFTKFKEWLADSAIGRFLNGDLPAFLNMPFSDYPMPGPTSYTNPNAAPDVPLNPLDILGGAGSNPPGAGGTPKPSGPGGLLLPSLTGPPPPGGPPGAPGGPPVPGARTPILTDTQQEAADAAASGGSESLPPAPSLPLQYRSTAGLDSSIAAAMNRQDEVEHAIAEKQARVNQLRASNVATEEDIQKAENDLTKAKNDRLKADQALVDAQQRATESQTKQFEKTTAELDGFFADIDSDFGVSEGLPGIAENITKFLMNLAIAPLMGQLGAQQMMAGFKPGEAGSGLFGMMANSGAFGSQFVGVPSWARGGSSGGYGSTGGYPGVGMPGMPFGISTGAGGTPTKEQVKAIAASFGLSVTSEDRPGESGSYHSTGSALDIGIPGMASNDPRKLAFAQYMSQNFGTSLEELIYNSPGFAGNVNDGKPHQYSAGTLADHNDHVHVAESTWGMGTPGDGMGDNYDRKLYGPGGTPWSADWNAIAQGESSGNWGINTGNGYYGGLQFLPSSWQAAGGTQYAPSAHQATPYQQAVTGERLLAMQGPGAWPNTFVPGSSGPANPAMLGMPGMNNLGAAPSASVTGGRAYGAGLPASGGASWSGGGLIGSALSGAMGAAGGAAGGFGGGAAAAGGQMAMQLLGRAAGAVGQYAGNAVGGVIETLGLSSSPLGDMSASWLGRIAGAAAGIRPALPNTAGEMGGEQNPNMREGGKNPAAPLTAQQAELQQKAMGGAAKAERNTTINQPITVNNNRAQEPGTGRDIQNSLVASNAALIGTR